jgi:uncharacterized protein (DUF2132 family)
MKTDWAREVVEKWYVQWWAKRDAYPDVKAFLANRIRTEHRRAVRVVEKLQKDVFPGSPAWKACDDILAALRKGRA